MIRYSSSAIESRRYSTNLEDTVSKCRESFVLAISIPQVSNLFILEINSPFLLFMVTTLNPSSWGPSTKTLPPASIFARAYTTGSPSGLSILLPLTETDLKSKVSLLINSFVFKPSLPTKRFSIFPVSNSFLSLIDALTNDWSKLACAFTGIPVQRLHVEFVLLK